MDQTTFGMASNANIANALRSYQQSTANYIQQNLARASTEEISHEQAALQILKITEVQKYVNRSIDMTKPKPKPTLLEIPRELRDKILMYLPLNPILDTQDAIVKYSLEEEAELIKYELSPNFLAACKQLSAEGYPLFYGTNIFYNVCRPDYPPRHIDQSMLINTNPLTRYIAYDTQGAYSRSLRSIPGVRKVRNWKVDLTLIDVRNIEKNISLNLKDFCRAIRYAAQNNIEFLVIPQGWESDVPGSPSMSPYETREILLAPIKLLRDVENTSIRDAGGPELPYGYTPTTRYGERRFLHILNPSSNASRKPHLVTTSPSSKKSETAVYYK